MGTDVVNPVFDTPGQFSGLQALVTGSDPYPEKHLANWLENVGMKVCGPTPGTPIAFVIIGRSSYDTELLGRIRPAVEPDRCISQEGVTGLALFGLGPSSSPLCARAQEHPGLAYMEKEFQKLLPQENVRLNARAESAVKSTAEYLRYFEQKKKSHLLKIGNGLLSAVEEGLALCRRMVSHGQFFDPARREVLEVVRAILLSILLPMKESRNRLYRNWPAESEFRAKYGYKVDAESTLGERRSSLEAAVKGLGLFKVANHIAAFISLESENAPMLDAVSRWKEDLLWLKETLYQGEFTWPEHWAL